MEIARHRRLRALRLAKQLIWLYLFLLVFEGVFRKWLFPSLSSPLNFMRDPVLIAIYVVALQNKFYIRNLGLVFLIALSLVSVFASLQFNPDLAAVAAFGFRANFLHLPLMFVIPRVFDKRDVLQVGRFMLIISLPLAILMALQFQAPIASWLNAGAGEGGIQNTSALGRVRPAATFTYTIGAGVYFTISTAFLAYYYFYFIKSQKPLIFAALAATILAMVVSGSRGLALNCFVALSIALISMTAVHPANLKRTLYFFLSIAVLGVVAAQIPLVVEAYTAFSMRITTASSFEGGALGSLNERVLSELYRPVSVAGQVPFWGEGLGIGTSGGGALLTGSRAFLAGRTAEGDWGRHVLESGPLLGFLFIFFRIYLLIYMSRIAFKSARRGNSLPAVLLGSTFYLLLLGQLGQSTIGGFVILTCGLVLAACQDENSEISAQHKEFYPPVPGVKPVNKMRLERAISHR